MVWLIRVGLGVGFESVFPRITLQATMEDWDPLLHTLGL